MGKYSITNDYKAAIVERLKKFSIPYWELADEIGIHENTLSKMMRRPNEEQAERINAAIDSIVEESRQQ